MHIPQNEGPNGPYQESAIKPCIYSIFTSGIFWAYFCRTVTIKSRLLDTYAAKIMKKIQLDVEVSPPADDLQTRNLQ